MEEEWEEAIFGAGFGIRLAARFYVAENRSLPDGFLGAFAAGEKGNSETSLTYGRNFAGPIANNIRWTQEGTKDRWGRLNFEQRSMTYSRLLPFVVFSVYLPTFWSRKHKAKFTLKIHRPGPASSFYSSVPMRRRKKKQLTESVATRNSLFYQAFPEVFSFQIAHKMNFPFLLDEFVSFLKIFRYLGLRIP